MAGEGRAAAAAAGQRGQRPEGCVRLLVALGGNTEDSTQHGTARTSPTTSSFFVPRTHHEHDRLANISAAVVYARLYDDAQTLCLAAGE